MRFQVRPKIININVSHGRGVTGDKVWLVCTNHLNGSTVVVPIEQWASGLKQRLEVPDSTFLVLLLPRNISFTHS